MARLLRGSVRGAVTKRVDDIRFDDPVVLHLVACVS
jgi:hypothetical protein